MTRSAATQKFSIDTSSSWFNTTESEPCNPRPLSRLQGRGRDYRGVAPFAPATFVPPPQPVARQVPPPPEIRQVPPPPEIKDAEFEMPRKGILGRLLALLRTGAPATKQLRLAETVALGEKRFVAIIHAEGRKYLVGGGPTGVALLAQLDGNTDSIETSLQSKGAFEAIR
jgi:hypothetical protein